MAEVTLEPDEVGARLEEYRRELTGYTYRMLGSLFEADDAVQEALVRAWRSMDKFQGRSSLRSWLYRITTNVCLDMLNSRSRRALPWDLSETASAPVKESLGTPLPEQTWVEPVPDARTTPTGDDPAEQAVQRDSIRLAFVAALQQLPPRQRAVLILRDVLRWRAQEVAELLESSVASVNSALQRARATLAARPPQRGDAPNPLDEEHTALLSKYVDAFERYDIDVLVSLLHEDATQCMPPYALWLDGPDDIAAWHLGPGIVCAGSRLLPVMANGSPGFAHYHAAPSGGHEPWAIQMLEVSDGRISSITGFLGTRLFPAFGLPARLDP
ncbi:MAG: sigma-70 family RNA polymerase sigma factor [Nocardioidaceae bacterium]